MTEVPRIIRRAQRLWRRKVQLPILMARVIWRQTRGDWFAFARSPDWFVRIVSTLPIYANPADEDEASVNEFIQSAIEERRMRARMRKVFS